MLKQFVVAYVLGAVTFWPLVASSIYLAFRYLSVASQDVSDSKQAGVTEPKRSKTKQYTLDHIAKLNSTDSLRSVDFESDIEASGWIRLSPAFITSTDPYEETESSQAKQPPSSARTSLQKLMRNSSFFSSFNSQKAKKQQRSSSASIKSAPPTTSEDSNSNGTASGGGSSANSSVNTETMKPKTIAKCPRYWAVIRGAQLQLYEDESELKLMELITVPKFVVSLWPQNLQEYELFYRKYPIALISRVDPEGVVSLDLYPGIPPRDALYIYMSNPVDKEDIYFALIKASKAEVASLTPILEGISLGPRDPVTMAKPVAVKKAETQQLQSSIWNNELPQETQWLNALLGRIFLAIKDSRLADAYMRRRFALKLKPISDSSNIIGEIEVKKISSGTAAPYFSNIKLKELSPDGNLVLSASISYNGGFKVILGTSVKLAAVTSLTTKEIPVELAATLRNLKGNIVIRVKPAPSERIWYAFETMPDVDLHIEPAVYETHISLSVVTKFIRGKILDSLKDTLVMPHMDDLAFYETTEDFYRGGIWETTPRDKTKKTVATAAGNVTTAADTSTTTAASAASAASVASTAGTGTGTGTTTVEEKPGETLQAGFATFKDTAPRSPYRGSSPLLGDETSPSSPPPPLAPRVRNRLHPQSSASSFTEGESTSSVPPTARQRFSSWVRRRNNSATALEPQESLEAEAEQLDNESFMNRSPSSLRGMGWTTTTTQVIEANASVERPAPNSPEVPSWKQTPRRKPVASTDGGINSSEDTEHSGETGSEHSVETGSGTGTGAGTTNDDASPLPDAARATGRTEPGNLGKLEFPGTVAPVAEMSNESIKGELIEAPAIRRESFSSKHSRNQSFDTRSILSNHSTRSSRSARSTRSAKSGPVLPPRNRRVVPLANLAPERD